MAFSAMGAARGVAPGTHFAPRAKRVLWVFMHGGPSHMDLWDPKPDLTKYAGQPLPESFGEVMTRRKVAKNPLLGPVKPFRNHGQSGLPISEFLPHMARHAEPAVGDLMSKALLLPGLCSAHIGTWTAGVSGCSVAL